LALSVMEVYGGGAIGGAVEHMGLLFNTLALEGLEVSLLSLPPHAAVLPAEKAGLRVLEASNEMQASEILRSVRPDIVHTHGLRPAVTAMRAGVHPWVRTVHSTIRSDYTSPLKLIPALAIERRALHLSDLVIAISRHVADERICLGVPREHVVVIPNAVPDVTQPKPGTVWQAEFGLPPSARVAVVLARLEAVKGVDRAVAALARLPHEWHLVVFGEGSRRDQLLRMAQELRLTDRTHLAGYRPDARAYLAASDVIVIPSREEGLSNVALEAMAARRPVAAMRTGGIPEALGEVAVYSETRDPGDLARAILAAWAARDDLGERGRRRYEDHFTPRVFARRTADALRGAGAT